MPPEQNNFHVLDTRLASLHDDIGEIKAVLAKLFENVTQIALLKQEQTHTSGEITKAFAAILVLQTKVAAIDHKLLDATRTSIWVDRVVWAAAGLTAMYVIKKVGLL